MTTPLRLWPGVALAVVVVLVRYLLPLTVTADASVFGLPFFIVSILGGVLGGLLILLWWLFFSRAPWIERLGAIVLMTAALLATSRVVHESISNGFMGNLLPFFAIPVLGVALVAAAVASRRMSTGGRRASIAAAILLACGAFTLIRTGGITGGGDSDLHWRWTPTPEDRLLAAPPPEPLPAPPTASVVAPSEAPAVQPTVEAAPEAAPAATIRADWPGFRGPDRDGVIHGVRIEEDWSKSPPVELWRRPIGPGWSSFAVHDNIFYTQEQRGEEEVVAAYRVTTGEPVWQHRDPVRFWESNGGAGPRGTPTLGGSRVYALGATGVLNVLDARSGTVVWSRNAASDAGVAVPDWGITSSPVVVDDLVIVAIYGRLAAFDAATGNPRWLGPVHSGSYSSPHLVVLDGVAQVLMQSAAGTTSVAPGDGSVLWEHAWPGFRIVQPAVISDGEVLISDANAAGGISIRRIAVAHGATGWKVEERWTSNGLKPYFNDFVVHKGHAFGFDGSILASIGLEDGKRTWKGGRYGHGQLVLLSDQDLLLVLSEDGELALVRAAPDQYTEVARVPAIDGKTWNHPVLVGDVLLVRNGEEMAAFRLSLASR